MAMESFADFLLKENYLSKNNLEAAKKIQNEKGQQLEEVVVEKGFISDREMAEAFAIYMDLPIINLGELYVNPDVIKLVPEFLVRKHTVIPIKEDGKFLMLAVSNPCDIFAIDDIKATTGFNIRIVLATKHEIEQAIERYFKPDSKPEVSGIYYNHDFGGNEKAPTINLVDDLILQAVKKNASDIHVEPFKDYLKTFIKRGISNLNYKLNMSYSFYTYIF